MAVAATRLLVKMLYQPADAVLSTEASHAFHTLRPLTASTSWISPTDE